MKIVIVPGWQNSGESHWQSIWERKLDGAVRIMVPSWDSPHARQWVDAIDAAIDGHSPVLLVAHSVGCLAAAEWISEHPDRTAAGFLVAPPDRHGPAIREGAPTFVHLPIRPLSVPVTVVSSRTDPYSDFETARAFAEITGARFVDAGSAGHINADAGYGDWPEGLVLLAELAAEVQGEPRPSDGSAY
jgi:predicted alpha/beta hydrolase family esterase